jgi:hypothetical protein
MSFIDLKNLSIERCPVEGTRPGRVVMARDRRTPIRASGFQSSAWSAVLPRK